MAELADLRQAALDCLLITDPWQKVKAVQQLYAVIQSSPCHFSQQVLDVPVVPGRPDRPELVAPRDLPRRRNHLQYGHATLIHAITHIEFNAINLGLDAVARFNKLPEAYYLDWLQVAFEEANHFAMLDAYLQKKGFRYGDFPAHDGLWEMAQKTHHDPLIRMALVPRVLEARGLDVAPAMMKKLEKSGDSEAVSILKMILQEEIGHVAIGTRWFNYLCEQRQLDPLITFTTLLQSYFTGEIRGPFHAQARQQAGFSDEEMAWLKQQCEMK